MGKTKAIAFIMVIFLITFFVMGNTFGEVPITIIFGNTEGFIYENENLGIGCQFDGWHWLPI